MTIHFGVKIIAVGALAAAGLFYWPTIASTASPSPALNPSVTLSAEPMLGGSFRPGSWAAVRVLVENRGPAIDGELRMGPASGAASTYSLAVQLASGARQQHVLYGRTGVFGTRFTVSLVSGPNVHAKVTVPVKAIEADSPGVYLVAERPQALVAPVRDAVAAGGKRPPDIVTLQPEDLPPRVEGWSSVDLLVWQDVASNRLDEDRLTALRTWLLMGGDLVILAGSTGATTLASFPADLLPYRPATVVDLPTTELEAILGTLPAGATPISALSGPLDRGTALARTGDAVVAARTAYGQGTVAVIGLDPSTAWLAGSPTADAFWTRIVPPRLATQDAVLTTNDDFLVNALSNLPAVQLPRLDHIFLLILGYIVAIGPINYLVLRRRDRREWAWLTMPLTIVGFALATYLLGVTLRGASVVINELALVQGSAGTDRGLAHVYVGVYSPGRANFDVRVAGHALVSSLQMGAPGDSTEQPIDVLLGEPATVRGYGVGFGALRAFRAQAAVSTPRVDAQLVFADDALAGTISNVSGLLLSDVAIVYGNGLQQVGDLAAGQSSAVSLATVTQSELPLSWRLYPDTGENDPDAVRTIAGRRALIQHLAGEWEGKGGMPTGGPFAAGPVILAWLPGGTLDIDVGTAAQHVGETLFVLPAHVAASGPITFAGGLMHPTVVAIEGDETFNEGGTFYLSRGIIAVDYRPPGFDGSFSVSTLSISLGIDTVQAPGRDSVELTPLPAAEQPDPSAPLASDPRPDEAAGVPRFQLFDRVAASWIEFEPLATARTYRIAQPERYVDEAGAFHARFVARSRDFLQFTFSARLEGVIE